MTNQNNAAQPVLTDDQIEPLVRNAEDEIERLRRALEAERDLRVEREKAADPNFVMTELRGIICVAGDSPTVIVSVERMRLWLSNLRAPVADERAALQRIVETAKDGANSGDRHARCVEIARAALASAPVAGEAQQESEALRQARHDSANAKTERERVLALAGWLDEQKFEPEMLSCAAATLRSMLSRDAAPQASSVAGEAVYTLRVRGAIQDWTPTAAAFSIPDGEHQLFLSPAALQASPVADRQRLRDLVDLVWNEATESTAVPDTPWADRMIDQVFPCLAASAPETGEAQPSDAEIMAIVRERCPDFDDAHEGPDQDDMIRIARALLSRYAAPQAPAGWRWTLHPAGLHPDVYAAAAARDSAEPVVRYCPGCGRIGPVEGKYRDCCPDGNEARMIPVALAEKCRDTFRIAVKVLLADAAANDSGAPQASADTENCGLCGRKQLVNTAPTAAKGSEDDMLTIAYLAGAQAEKERAGDALLAELLDDPLLRDLLGYIEDTGPADVWGAAQAWMAKRNAALAARKEGDARASATQAEQGERDAK